MTWRKPAKLPRFQGRLLEVITLTPTRDGATVTALAVGVERHVEIFEGPRALENAAAYVRQLANDEQYRREDAK